MITRKIILFLAMAILLVATGCSSKGGQSVPQSSSSQTQQPQQQQVFSLATGGTGGTYYVVGSGMAKIVEQYVPNTKLVVQATAASTENIRLVGSKKVDFAIALTDGAYFAMRGEREFAGKEKYDNIRAVMAGHVSQLQIFVLEKSGIKQISDLKGKKLALSAPASPAIYIAKAALEAYGLKDGDYKPVLLSYAEQVEAIKDGTIDAGFIYAAAPTSSIMDLASVSDIRILPIEESKLDEAIKKYPYFIKGKIKAGTYKGQNEDVPALAGPAIMITRDDVDEDVVYNITKALCEHTDELGAVHPAGLEWDLGDAVEGTAIPLHPGAEKYFKEKGILK